MMAESGVTGWSPIQSVTETTRHPLRARTSFMCDREGHNRALEMERKIITLLCPSTHSLTQTLFTVVSRNWFRLRNSWDQKWRLLLTFILRWNGGERKQLWMSVGTLSLYCAKRVTCVYFVLKEVYDWDASNFIHFSKWTWSQKLTPFIFFSLFFFLFFCIFFLWLWQKRA